MYTQGAMKIKTIILSFLVYASFLFVSFYLVGCRKNDFVTGTVTNLLTGQPVQNIKVNVTGINSGFFSNKDLKQLNSGLTNTRGEFSIGFKFKENKKSEYRISIDGSHQVLDSSALI